MAIAKKDLTTEIRAKAGFNGVASLAVTILILLGLALGPDASALRNAAVGAVWLATLFSGVLAFNRSFQVELESGALESLLLYPGPRWTIFAAVRRSSASVRATAIASLTHSASTNGSAGADWSRGSRLLESSGRESR